MHFAPGHNVILNWPELCGRNTPSHSVLRPLKRKHQSEQGVFLNIFEIFVRTMLDFLACSLITYDNTVAVHLQSGDGPHLRHGALNRGLQCAGLVMTVTQYQHFLG